MICLAFFYWVPSLCTWCKCRWRRITYDYDDAVAAYDDNDADDDDAVAAYNDNDADDDNAVAAYDDNDDDDADDLSCLLLFSSFPLYLM